MNLKHSIQLSSIQNARELGGYMAADGRKIKDGVLLRTANLHMISDEDIRMLTDTYHIQHIVDFRLGMELSGAEDPPINGAEYHHLDVIDLSAMDVENGAAPDMTKLDVLQIVEFSLQSGMINENMYTGFLANDMGKKAYSEFFRILLSADPERAVLWHCTSGKDRTGLAAMLLLSALGADEETIIADYLLTNDYYAPRIAGMKQLLRSKGCDDAYIDQAILVFDAVNERYLHNAIAYLKKEYGSANGYIRDGLNISQSEIEILKEKYLV
ncbi:MAG: tyrosine-protein phosphatase [Ruminococcus sp.]|nr:tyrosine-protein phosphatase [Ruminococcus sp.]